MGYPMSYRRVIERGKLEGDYAGSTIALSPDSYRLSMIAGDLRRLEKDVRDPRHLALYAERSGATAEQVERIFDLFFDHDIWTEGKGGD